MIIISKLLLTKNLKFQFQLPHQSITTHFLTNNSFSAYSTNTNTATSIRKYSPVDDYQITGFLGKGSSSRVYQGYNILTKKQVIIKLFKDIIPQQKILQQIRANQIISQCKHIIPMIDIVKDQGCGSYGLIFLNLHGVPLNLLAGKIQFDQGLKYIKNILQAIDFCHKHGVVHRDLKNSNILITSSGAKLFDFGLSKIEKIDQFNTKRFGTKCYYTPQVIFRIPRFNRKIDIWVLGLIMSQVLSQKKPLMPYSSDQMTARQIVEFSGFNQNIISNSSLKYIRRINFNKLFQGKTQDKNKIKQAAQIVQKMMRIDPNQRPQAEEILRYDLFVNIQDK